MLLNEKTKKGATVLNAVINPAYQGQLYYYYKVSVWNTGDPSGHLLVL